MINMFKQKKKKKEKKRKKLLSRGTKGMIPAAQK